MSWRGTVVAVGPPLLVSRIGRTEHLRVVAAPPVDPAFAVGDSVIVDLESGSGGRALILARTSGDPVGAGTGGVHPGLATHDALGLATQAELDAVNASLAASIAALPGGGATALPGLTDVSDTLAPTVGSLFLHNGTEWQAGAGTTDTSGEAMVVNTGFGALWKRKDTRRMVVFRSPGTTADTWTNMPAAVTEFLGSTLHRVILDLQAATEARVCARVSIGGASGTTGLRAQYSLDTGTTWSYLDGASSPAGSGSGPEVLVGAGGTFAGSWATIHANAKVGSALVRLVGIGGDGVSDPAFGNVHLETR